MDKAQDGQFVQIQYKGTLENGDVFDSNEGRPPLEFQIGSGQVIPGFEAAIKGMAVSEKKNFTLPPEEAYGVRDEGLLKEFPRADIPPGFDPKAGDTVALMGQGGQQVPAMVTEADDQKVVVDLNHPLAGKSLTFDITVLGVTEAATQTGCGCGCDDTRDGCGSDGCGCDDTGEGCGSGGCGC